jgi:hypothetical protein
VTAEELESAARCGEASVDGDIVYAQRAALESVGVLLDRRSGDVEVLGSALSLPLYVWAKQRGFKLHAANRIVIRKIRQHDEAVATLRCAFDARHIRAELVRTGTQPLRLELDWPRTALLIEALRTSDAFDYEVNPRE